MAEYYALSSVGNAILHPGLTITYDRQRGTLALSNSNYIVQMAIRFGIPLEASLLPATPFSKTCTRLYSGAVTGEPLIGGREQQAYHAGVGSLKWQATTNRPDLAFAISQSRFLATPTDTFLCCAGARAEIRCRDTSIRPVLQTSPGHQPSHPNDRGVNIRDRKPAGGIL